MLWLELSSVFPLLRGQVLSLLRFTCLSLFCVSRMFFSTWSALLCMREMSTARSWPPEALKGTKWKQVGKGTNGVLRISIWARSSLTTVFCWVHDSLGAQPEWEGVPQASLPQPAGMFQASLILFNSLVSFHLCAAFLLTWRVAGITSWKW